MIQSRIKLYYKCLPKDTDDVLFLDQDNLMEEHISEYDLNKPVEECEDP